MSEPMIEALQAERRGYLARGLAERVAAVDAQLAALGVSVPRVETPEAEDAPKRRGRK